MEEQKYALMLNKNKKPTGANSRWKRGDDTEIIKTVITDNSKYNIIVLVVSIVLTVAAAMIASSIFNFVLTWYVIFAAIVASFFIAYGAMLGYDKLIKRLFSVVKDAVNLIKNIRNEDNGMGGMAKYRSPFKAGSKETCAFKKKGTWAAGYHTGVDRISDNTALVSPANGTVQKNAYSDSYGNYVIITTDEGMSILMAHMKEKSTLKVGAKIKAGDPVGTMGSTGNSTGPHLHIEIENTKTWAYNTKLLNPNDYIDWSDTLSVGTATPATASSESYPTAVAWKNGSTKETVFKQSNLKEKIGSLSPKESAKCYGKQGNYIVVYDLDGTNGKHKTGFTEYAGGVKTAPTGGKTYKNGSTPETVYADTAKKTKVGSLDPNEKCTCLGKIDGMYLVLYKVNNTSYYKCGFVD